MGDLLPVRRVAHNISATTASPASFIVLATRFQNPDATIVVARDEIAAEPDEVRRYAVTLLDTVVHFHGQPADVQVITKAGCLVFAVQAGGLQ